MLLNHDQDGFISTETIDAQITQHKLILCSRKRRTHKIKGIINERKKRVNKSSTTNLEEQIACESGDKELPILQESLDDQGLLKQKRRRCQSRRKQQLQIPEQAIASPQQAQSNAIEADLFEPIALPSLNLEVEKREIAENDSKRKLVFTITQHKL